MLLLYESIKKVKRLPGALALNIALIDVFAGEADDRKSAQKNALWQL